MIRSSLTHHARCPEEFQIVGFAARRGGITLDEKAITWMILRQPLDIGIQRSLVQSMVKAIMGKRDFVHIFVEGLLLRTKENHSWFRRGGNPIASSAGAPEGPFANSVILVTRSTDRNESNGFSFE